MTDIRIVKSADFLKNVSMYHAQANNEPIAIQRPDGKIVLIIGGPVALDT